MDHHLLLNYNHSPTFIYGIVKVINKQDISLSKDEKTAMTIFEKVDIQHSSTEDESKTVDYADRIIKKARVKPTPSSYINLEFIQPTSNVIERLFSQVGLVLDDSRSSMTPRHVEETIVLKMNSDYWNTNTLQDIIN